MRTSTIVIVVVVIAILGGLFWYMHTSSPSIANPAAQSPTVTDTGTPEIPANVLSLGQSNSLGSYLISNPSGMTLYVDNQDSSGTSMCINDCAKTWPPYTVTSPNNISVEADIFGTVGTIVRPDGTYQVTYNGKPLYFYAQDVSKSDMNGAGIDPNWSVALP